MQRITRLCLAAFVATAMVVLPSTASAAPGFKSESKQSAVSGDTVGTQLFSLGAQVVCNEATLAGALNSPAFSLQVTPNITGCESGTYKSGFGMNGCTLTLRPGAETSKGVFKGTVDIGPAGCGPITITTAMGCKPTLGAQAGLAATFENVGSGSSAKVMVAINATGIKYTQSSGLCGGGTHNNGTWNGTFEVKSNVGGPSGLRVVTDVPVGLDLTPGQPQIEAERYPSTLVGSQSVADELTFKADVGTARCNNVALDGLITVPSVAIGLSAVNTGCTAFGLYDVPVVMNGCKYLIGVAAAGTPYEGIFGIYCPAGKKIEIKAPGCLVTIGDQSAQVFEGVELKSVGSSNETRIEVDLDISGLEYTETRPLFGICPNNGTRNNGTLSGTLTVGAI